MIITLGHDGTETWVRFGEGPRIPLADLTPEQRKRVKAAGLLDKPKAAK